MVDLLNKKTKNACKILTVELDLRKEEACKELVKKHLDFHRKLDSMYAVYYSIPMRSSVIMVRRATVFSIMGRRMRMNTSLAATRGFATKFRLRLNATER